MTFDKPTHLSMPPIVVLDFDGVLHAYTSGWTKADEVLDGPIDGAIEYLRELQREGFRVQIWSARSHQQGGIKAMKDWFRKHGMTIEELHEIDFLATIKPWFCVYVDDNGFRFQGKYPTPAEIKKLKQWNKSHDPSKTN